MQCAAGGSSSASCQHIFTVCIRGCTYMDTLPLTLASKIFLLVITVRLRYDFHSGQAFENDYEVFVIFTSNELLITTLGLGTCFLSE